MTGTSLDGLDAALVEVSGRGLAMRARVVRCLTRPLGELAGPLRRLASREPMAAGAIATLARDLALLHAEAVRALVAGDRLDLVCVHGQTVYHAPPVSWQLMNAAPIARAVGAPVVFDLRAADLAAGGQGAPITPLADWVLFGAAEGGRIVVNLGGFANYTGLPDGRSAKKGSECALDEITGGDICACNQLLDAVARARLGCAYDGGGRAASRGRVDGPAYEELAALLRSQARAGRSLGTGDELARWVESTGHLPAEHVARTACEAIAQVIVETCGDSNRMILAGGGAMNEALVAAIRGRSDTATTSDAFGVPVAYREAACFAVLGALCQDRVPITLPRVTGVGQPAPVAGAWVYP